jgi:hypothetical protein
MKKINISGIFKLLESINMKFPQGRTGLADKVRFEEKVNFVLRKADGNIVQG